MRTNDCATARFFHKIWVLAGEGFDLDITAVREAMLDTGLAEICARDPQHVSLEPEEEGDLIIDLSAMGKAVVAEALAHIAALQSPKRPK